MSAINGNNSRQAFTPLDDRVSPFEGTSGEPAPKSLHVIVRIGLLLVVAYLFAIAAHWLAAAPL